MPKQEIILPEAGEGPAYNRKGISPQEFLIAVMEDQKLPMSARMQAAKDVAVYVHARLAQVTQDMNAGITIRIEGGLPALPGTNIIMPTNGQVQPDEDQPDETQARSGKTKKD